MSDKRIYELTEASSIGDNDLFALDNQNFAETKKVKKSTLTDSLVNKDDISYLDITGSTNTSGGTITKGTYFYLNRTLCIALADIANAATFTFETNYTQVTVGQELATLTAALNDKAVIGDMQRVALENIQANTYYAENVTPPSKPGYKCIGGLPVSDSSNFMCLSILTDNVSSYLRITAYATATIYSGQLWYYPIYIKA